jgi:CheY-like chemotaxis protein
MIEEKGNDVVIEIKCDDTGIGINPNMLQKVYDEFTQEDESFARKYGGSGLGLSITRKLTELMGGTIHIESEKDKGTHVTICLPMSRDIADQTNHALPTEAEALSLLQNKRFLLVDDNKFNRLVISIILDKYHLQYDEAENGNEALDKLKANKYDLVLMDIQMPEKDGLEATREMREVLKLTTPVLIMTAQGFSEDIENLKRRGVNDVIFKPFKEQAFLNKVMHQLSEHQ